MLNTLNEILAMSKIGVMDWNMQTNEMFWNDTEFDIFSIDRQQVQGGTAKPDFIWVNMLPEDIPFMQQHFSQFTAHCTEGETCFAQFRVKRPKDGAVRWIEGMARLQRDTQGRPLRMYGCHMDITERKTLESERLEVEGLRFKIEEANKYQKQLHEFIDHVSHELRNPGHGILGNTENLLEIVQDLERTVSQLSSVSQQHPAAAVSSLPQGQDQNQTNVLLQHISQQLQSAKEGLHSILECSMHQKHILDDVLHLSKLEAKMITLHPVTFDLKELTLSVARMQGYQHSQSVAHEAQGLFPSQSQHHTDTMDSKTTSQQLKVHCRGNITLHVEIRDSSGQLMMNGSNSGSGDDAVVFSVYQDPLHLKSILINLIANALKFSSENGHVWVRLQVLESPAGAEDQLRVRFEVQDEGVGMTQEQIDQLFNRFRQLHSRERYGGSGLGLVISQSLLKLYDEQAVIRVVSEGLGRGSRFSFDVSLPLSRTPHEAISVSSVVTPVSPVSPSIERQVAAAAAAAAMASSTSASQAATAAIPLGSIVTNMQLPSLPRAAQPYVSAQAFAGLEALNPNQPLSTVLLKQQQRKNSVDSTGSGGGGPSPRSPRSATHSPRSAQSSSRQSSDSNRRDSWLLQPSTSSQDSSSSSPLVVVSSSPNPLVPQLSTSTAPAPVQSQQQQQQQKIVIIVEDNIINQKLLNKFVRDAASPVAQPEVLIFADGAPAVEYFQSTVDHDRIACVFMDLVMPIMSGLEATRKIREAEAAMMNSLRSPVPIIGLSGNSAGEDDALKSGMNTFLTKPCTKQQILRAMEVYARK